MTSPGAQAQAAGGVHATPPRRIVGSLVAFSAIVVLSVGVLVAFRLQAGLYESRRQDRQRALVVTETLRAFETTVASARGYLLVGDRASLERLEEARRELASQAGLLGDLWPAGRMGTTLAEIMSLRSAYDALVESAVTERRAGVPLDQVAARYESSAMPLRRQIFDALRGISSDQMRLVDEAHARVKALSRRLYLGLVALCGLSLATAAVAWRRDRRAREAIARERYFNQRLSDVSPVLLFVFDVENGRPLYVSQRVVEAFGMGRDQLLASSTASLLEELVHPEDVSGIVAYVQRARECADGDVITHEFRHRHADGTWHTYLSRSAVFDRDASGRATQIIAAATDVTDRVRAEEEARTTRRLLEALYEQAPIGLSLHGVDLRCRIINPTLARLNGVPVEQTVGKPLDEFLAPPLAGQIGAVMRQVLTTGLPSALSIQAVAPGGTEEGRFDVRCYPIFDAQGRTMGVGNIVEDVTARTRAAAQIAENERLLSALVSNLPGVVYRCSNRPEWPMEYVSPQLKQVTGIDPRDMVEHRRNFGELIHPADAGRVWDEVQRALGERKSYQLLYRICREDGEERWVEEYGQGIFRGDKLEFLQGFIMDVTARKHADDERERLVAQLQDAVSIRDEFLIVAAHELRTPITAMRLFLEAVRHGLAEATPTIDQKLIERLDGAVRQTGRLNQLVQTLLEVSRLGRMKPTLELETVNLVDLASEVLERVSAEATRVHSPIQLEMKEQERALAEGQWDRTRIEQVLTNLLTNALKFGSGHPVLLTITPQEHDVVFSVTDRGIGVQPGDEERIFRRFERAVPTRNYGGLGLGLYVAREIVEAHGGQIGVVSQPGQGARFWVRLPRVPPLSIESPVENSTAVRI